jgi:hypothetical protein
MQFPIEMGKEAAPQNVVIPKGVKRASVFFSWRVALRDLAFD